MNANGRFTLDTNLLFYASDSTFPEKRDRAQHLIEIAVEQDCVLPLQVLAELFHALTRRHIVSAEAAGRIVLAFRETFKLVAASESDLADAILAVQQHNLSFWDAMLWATTRRAGCTLLFSEDLQHGRVIGGVTLLNPFLVSPADLRSLVR